ncbi:MAG: RNA polymerase sigma factor [Clostridia bacterium]|nr:RNA polymerase sigma factor [Clostridia bacterium]
MKNGESSYHRFLEGEKDAFAEIVEIYRQSLTFFINRYLSNLGEAEEIAEDCFVELIVHPRRYNFKTSLKTYLFTIARNKAIDKIRKKKFTLKDSEEVLSSASEDFSDFYEDFLKNEQKKSLHSALNRLNDDYKTALHLVYFENMSYEEASLVMKKDLKQVTNLVYRAKISLKEILEREGFTYEG